MSTEQPGADAYGQELARINHHQSKAIDARSMVFQALAAVGIGHEQADDIVAQLEAGAVAGAHTWISESSAPHGSEPRFEDGWHARVRDVASSLLRIADTTATTGRGLAASNAMLVAHLQQPASPAPQAAPVEEATPAAPAAPAGVLDATDVLAAAERFPWAVAAPGVRHWPDGGDFLDVALSAVRPEERAGYIERLEAFVVEHRPRLEKMLRTHGPGSKPATHGRYALIGQPETLVIVERMESAPFLLRAQWEEELEIVFLGTSSSCGGRVPASAGEQPGTSAGPDRGGPVRARRCVVGRGRTGLLPPGVDGVASQGLHARQFDDRHQRASHRTGVRVSPGVLSVPSAWLYGGWEKSAP
ncbi:hypothetical protein [Streptomyces sp. NPDC008125]|uniref:hypothetical protein n=1 Tax=Streptomyces sp. NPDC008125 TaxID=3364811 RepID=UPI0036EDAA74